MQVPRIIIITYVYNAEKYIEETIHSVLNQTYENYIWVLVENGSKDGSRNILRKYKDYSHILYLESDYNSVLEPEKYNLKDWREIINPSDDDYITNLDSDDFLEKNALEILAKNACNYDADIVFGGCKMFFDGVRESVYIRKPLKTKVYDSIKELFFDWEDVYGSIRVNWGNLYKYEIYKDVYEYIKSIKVSNGADTMQNLYMLNKAKKIATVSEALINYRLRNNSVYKRIIADRYKVYDLIRDRTCELFKMYDCRDKATYGFVEACRFRSMQDLIVNLVKAKDNYDESCQLLFNILSDEGFAKGLEEYNLSGWFLAESIEKVRENIGFFEKTYDNNFATALFYGVLKNDLLSVISAIYNIENVNLWGKKYIKELINRSSSWIKKIFGSRDWDAVFEADRELITLIFEGKFREVAEKVKDFNESELSSYEQSEKRKNDKLLELLKLQILDAADKGVDPEEQIKKAFAIRILDKELIKTLLYAYSILDNIGRLNLLCELIIGAYGNDSDMLYMAALGYEKTGKTIMEVNCLRRAIENTIEEDKKREYENEIKRIIETKNVTY